MKTEGSNHLLAVTSCTQVHSLPLPQWWSRVLKIFSLYWKACHCHDLNVFWNNLLFALVGKGIRFTLYSSKYINVLTSMLKLFILKRKYQLIHPELGFKELKSISPGQIHCCLQNSTANIMEMCKMRWVLILPQRESNKNAPVLQFWFHDGLTKITYTME